MPKKIIKLSLPMWIALATCSCTVGSSPTTPKSLNVMYNFTGNSNGTEQWANLTLGSDGYLYGITSRGGEKDSGVIYKILPDGTNYQVIYNLNYTSNTFAPLTEYNNKLYGVTQGAGANGMGTIFSINHDGSNYTLLHSFILTEGAAPTAGLYWSQYNNKFYSTTKLGGNINCPLNPESRGSGAIAGCGSLYSFDPSNNNFTMLYAFDGSVGSEPFSSFSQVDNTPPESNPILYTTLGYGGPYSHGSIVSWNMSNETNESPSLVYAFGFDNIDDGKCPWASPTFVNGVLYGTTWIGGASNAGIIYKLNGLQTENILYNYTGSTGSSPYSGLLLASDGNLYGTTYDGGTGNCGIDQYGLTGCGTVFKYTPGGNYSVIANFDGTNGSYPRAGLIEVNKKLFGVTTEGGVGNKGVIYQINLAQ